MLMFNTIFYIILKPFVTALNFYLPTLSLLLILVYTTSHIQPLLEPQYIVVLQDSSYTTY